ncbi:MAG: hypothetical protein OEW42_12945 [Acidimicrobiia bacterium]|nr:hypothetical protein [Acidimicrobiia bacterium]
MHRTLESAHIASLIELLLQAQTDQPTAVGVTESADGEIELSFRPLPGPDPVAELIGFRAPAAWAAFAITSPGRLLDATDAPPAAHTVQMVHLLTREGDAFTSLRLDDQAGDAAIRAQPEGRVPDACRRVLGQPTAPPPHGTARLAAGLWLDGILRALLDRELDAPPLSWPACQAHLTPRPLTGDQLLAFGSTFAERWPWAIIRRVAIAQPILHLPDGAAEWLDDGSFARWVLGELAPLDELRADVAELLGPTTGARLESVLDHWLDGRHR